MNTLSQATQTYTTAMVQAGFCIAQIEAVAAGGALEILPTTHFKGDLAAYTGCTEHLYGQTGYELILLEGHRKGDNVWTYRAPKARKAGAS